jgi:UDP-2,4-diacetamido-2,4,6-trideoxy-beta-L-altropyranose hydrolase
VKFAFRVDASHRIGTGHIRRDLSLAHTLRSEGAEVVFVSRDLGLLDWVRRAIGGRGYQLLTLPRHDDAASARANLPVPHADWAGVDWQTDAQQSVAALASFAPDWLVLDHYAFDARWQVEMEARLGVRLCAIDDLADRPLHAQLLVDHNWHPDYRQKYAGLLPANCRLLAGPSYALLDPAYAVARRYDFSPEVRSIGIFMGGSDGVNASEAVLEAVVRAGFERAVEIASTSANPYIESLRATVDARPDTRLNIDLPNLAEFFARHDLQIGAGGGATWERLCIGAPSILLPFAENHMDVLRPLGTVGVAHIVDPGWSSGSLAIDVGTMIADAPGRRAFSEAGRALVDGQGTMRVARAMREAC